MTVAAVLLVTAVVWAISLIRSVRLRALVYSLPVPMTLALATTGFRVDGAQVLGVVALNVFFLTVSVLHHRLGWHILVADLLGVAAYLLLSAVLLRVGPVPFAGALAGTLAGWLGAMLVLRRGPPPGPPRPVGASGGAERAGDAGRTGNAGREALAPPVKLLVILCGALSTVLLGDLLRQMVVTFPYSGVLVAVEARRDLPEFTRHFARNSLGLVAFVAGFHWLQDQSRPVALGGAWMAFALVALALQLSRPGSRPGRRLLRSLRRLVRARAPAHPVRTARRAQPPGCP